MGDEVGAHGAAGAGHKIGYPGGKSRLDEQIHQTRSNDWRLVRRLYQDSVAGDDGGSAHAGENGQGKIPGRDDESDPARPPNLGIAFAEHALSAPGAAQVAHLNRVEIAKINGLSHVGISLRRSEEHTSELQSHVNLVCRLLLEK